MSVDPSSRGWNEHRHRWDVPAGTIQTADIADGSITTPKLAGLAVTAAKIANGAVGTTQLAAGAATQDSVIGLTTNVATNSAAFVDVPGVAITLTTAGGPVLVFACGPATAVGGVGGITFNQDGVDQAVLVSIANGGPANMPWAVLTRYAPAAGSHTYKLRYNCAAAGTLSFNFSSVALGLFHVLELKR